MTTTSWRKSPTAVDDSVIYTLNFYLPSDYIKPDKREKAGLPIVSHPGAYTNFDGLGVTLNKNYLTTVLHAALDFRQQHNAPVLVNQVGVRNRCNGHPLIYCQVFSVGIDGTVACQILRFLFAAYQRTRTNFNKYKDITRTSDDQIVLGDLPRV